MGTTYEAKCNSCGAVFPYNEGGGMAFHKVHCVKCGKEKDIGFDQLPEDDFLNHEIALKIAGKCRCGGKYSFSAVPRCPECRSTEVEKGEEIVWYD